jgi:hypothetical protein
VPCAPLVPTLQGAPWVAVPVHDQALSAAGRSIHYRQLEQLGAKGGSTLRVLDDGAPADL